MTSVGNAIDAMIKSRSVDTGKVGGLSRQIIAQTNTLGSNILLSIEGLNDRLSIVKSDSMHPFLQLGARQSLRQVLNEQSNLKMRINSAYRTVAQQHILHQLYVRQTGLIKLAAKPGRSNHENGLALDIEDFSKWKPILEANRWIWQGEKDKVHFSFSIGNNELGKIGVQAFQSLWNKYNPEDIMTVDGSFGDLTAERMNRSPAAGFVFRIFKKGDKSPTILKIRQALIAAGFKIPISDFFDPAMEKAVKDFQQKRGLVADGVIGQKTMSELFPPSNNSLKPLPVLL
jgi:N-acetylmuramoyl-L-alanine amidase